MRRSATTGSCLGSNLTKKMPHGWLCDERPEPLDLLDLGGIRRVDPELLGRVVEGQVLEVVRESMGQSSSSRRNLTSDGKCPDPL